MEIYLETRCKQYTRVPRISKKTGVGTKSIPEAAEPIITNFLSSESVSKNITHSARE